MLDELQVRPIRRELRRARVCLIYTGGTIGMTPLDSGSASRPRLKSASFEEILAVLSEAPGLGEAQGIELGYRSFVDPIDSSDMGPHDWQTIAMAIEEHYDDFDGFVVLHGTDTMAYTASALSFMLRNLGKPVVVTGSQLPMREARGDARTNLASSILIAAHPASGLPLIPEVVLVFMDRILRGNRAVKVSSNRWLAFDSPNFPWLGSIGKHITVRTDLVLPPPPARSKFRVDRELGSPVAVLHMFPGIHDQHIQQILSDPELQGVILLTYGAGNIPSCATLEKALRDAVERGVLVVDVTQCLEGSVELGLYESSSGLLEAGVASGLDLTPEAALAKAMWVIGTYPRSEQRAEFIAAQRGEQSLSLIDVNVPGEGLAERHQVACRLTRPFSLERLRQATVRIQGVRILAVDEDLPAILRLHVNESGNGGSMERGAGYCGEVATADLSPYGSVMFDVTEVFRNTYQPGPPIGLRISGVNAEVAYESIQLSVFAES